MIYVSGSFDHILSSSESFTVIYYVRSKELFFYCNIIKIYHFCFEVNFDDLQSENFENHQVYGRSKSCNILFAVQLAKKLKGKPLVLILIK